MNEMIKLLKRDWRYLLLIAGFFTLGIWIGTRLLLINPQMATELKKEALEKFSEITKWMKQAPPGTEFFVIWINNILASVTAFLIGILPPFSLFNLMFNGILIGLFQNTMEAESSLSPIKFYLSLVPHGIFELPAFFMAVLLGIRFGLIPYRLIYHYLKTKEHLPLFRQFFKEARLYAVLIIVMLFVAAVIEVGISPLILSLWLRK